MKHWRILIPAGFAAWFLFGMAQLAEAADAPAASSASSESSRPVIGDAEAIRGPESGSPR